MNSGVDGTGKSTPPGSGVPDSQGHKTTGKKDHRVVTKIDAKPVLSRSDTKRNNQGPEKNRPESTSLYSRSVSAIKNESAPLSTSFCEFQLEVAEAFAEKGPIRDDLIVYWVGEDSTMIAVDPPDDRCTENHWDHYQAEALKFRENSDPILKVCKQQLTDAQNQTYTTNGRGEDEKQANNPPVTFSRFFSMIGDGGSLSQSVYPDGEEGMEGFEDISVAKKTGQESQRESKSHAEPQSPVFIAEESAGHDQTVSETQAATDFPETSQKEIPFVLRKKTPEAFMDVSEDQEDVDLKNDDVEDEMGDTYIPNGETVETNSEDESIIIRTTQALLRQEGQQTLSDVLSAQAIKVGSGDAPIQTAIKRLAQAASTGDKGRFQTFFDDPIVTDLSGIEVYSSDRKAEGQHLDVEWIEPFITAYKCAVLAEKKADTPEQAIKKARRIKAIDTIETFIKAQNKNSPDYKKQCLFACQMLLRVREPGFVCQRNTPTCGGFALLQHLWRTKPDQVTDVLLSLHSPDQKTVVTAQNGSQIILTPPADEAVMAKYREDWADKLFIHSLYKSVENGSTLLEDAYRAFYFGESPLLCTNAPKTQTEQDQFLRLLSEATKEKYPVAFGFNGDAANTLEMLHQQHKTNKNLSRKSKSGGVHTLAIQRGQGSTGHTVIVEQVLFNKQDIELKLHTWGKSKRYKISRADFFNQLEGSANNVVIYAENSLLNDSEGFFAEPPPYRVSYINDRPTYTDCTGKKGRLPIGDTYEGLDGVKYHCYENGTYLKAQKHEKFLPLKGTSDSVVWGDESVDKEQVLRALPSNNVYLVNEHGEAKRMEVGKAMAGFDEHSSYTLCECDDTSFSVNKTTISS